jgi:hypothetical protein
LESAQNEEEKRRIRTREKVLKLWSKVINGLRIQQRIQDEYGDDGPKGKMLETESVPAGGFITDADRSVAPFTLPKPSIFSIEPGLQSQSLGLAPEEDEKITGIDFSQRATLPYVGNDMGMIESGRKDKGGIPISMESLAERERDKVNERIRSEEAEPDTGNRVNIPIRQRTKTTDLNKPYPEISATDRKRTTRFTSNSVPSTRNLRPRPQKSKAVLDAEQRTEQAIRDAIEDYY